MPEDADVVTLGRLAQELLEEARSASAGRTARTVTTGPLLRATVIALVGGAEMAEHDSPPAATLQVVSGEVRLISTQQEWSLAAGDLAAVPPFRHRVVAVRDAVLLLTVALH